MEELQMYGTKNGRKIWNEKYGDGKYIYPKQKHQRSIKANDS